MLTKIKDYPDFYRHQNKIYEEENKKGRDNRDELDEQRMRHFAVVTVFNH